MKKLVLIFFLIVLKVLRVFAQDLETPEIVSVGVDTLTGKPLITWIMQNPDEVDGYIIKRLITDGDGVISGTYNNVAVIENNKVFSYVDLSNSYNTEAKAEKRKEYYRISSFKVNQDGQTIYSLMSNQACTMTLNGEFDYCTNTFELSFSSFYDSKKISGYCLRTGFPKSERLLVTKDTTCRWQFKDFLPTRNFAVEAILTNGVSVFSPIILVDAEETVVPELTIQNITVGNPKGLELKIKISETSSTEKLLITRRDLENNESGMSELDFHNGDFIFCDTSAEISKLYAYSLYALNSCGIAIKFSDSTANTVLKVKPSETENQNILEWNEPLNMVSGAIKTEIFRSIDDGDLEYVDVVNSFYSDYQESLSNIIANKELYEGKFCYQIKIYHKNPTETDTLITVSNVACIEREPIVFFPNALNPKSVDTDNWEFKPKADFLRDYKMSVYSKRGEKLFETTDISKGWDGYNRSGKLCPRDTYIYIASFTTAHGKPVTKKGYVNLVY